VRRLAFLLLFAGGAGADDSLETLLAELDAEVAARREGGAGGEADALAAEVLALRSRAAEAAPPPATDVQGMHVVYVGEGSLVSVRRVRVQVTARSRPIILALWSLAPVRWHVDAAPGVDLRRVVSAGSRDALVVGPPQVPVETLAERADFPFDEKREALARAAEEASGYVVWTLLDAGTADPAVPIVVGPGNAEWSAQTLRTEARLLHWRETRGRRAAQCEDLKACRFGALYRWRDASRPQPLRVSFGEWTPLGPLLGRQTVLPDMLAETTAVASDDERGDIYLLRHGVLLSFSLPKGPPEVLRVPDTLPQVREPCALAVDTRRRRLLLATKHDHGYLYAMDLKSREWCVLNDMDDIDPAGMAYDEQRDAILCVAYGDGGAAKLHRFSPEDARHQRETLLRLPLMPEKRPLTIACRKGLLVLLEPPPPHLAHRDADQSRAFVVEPHSGESLFSSRTRPWEDFLPLDDARLEALWHDLAFREGADAGRAMRELAGQGDRAVAFLARRFTPEERVPEELGRWVALLADDDALVRDLAHFRLVQAGPRAEAFLAGLDPAELQPEARRRVVAALGEVGGNRRVPRNARAIQVLEWIETPDAVALLRDLGSSGDPRRRAHANAALARIDRPRR